MKKPLPMWASETCEDCIYEVDGRCRHHINNYGYTSVKDSGKYRPACSYFATEESK